jgi:hypothetical protein
MSENWLRAYIIALATDAPQGSQVGAKVISDGWLMVADRRVQCAVSDSRNVLESVALS